MLYFINLIFILSNIVFVHPFHVSVSDVNYNQESKAVEITHKIFLDDLENALNRRSESKVDILNSAANNQLNDQLIVYLENHFSLNIDGEKINLDFVGSEIQADAIWIYQESPSIKSFSEISIKNTILFEMFEDQTNLVHIKKGKSTKSLRLYDKNSKGEVKFK